MTGQQMIDQCILRLPNSFKNNEILQFLNDELNLCWKDIGKVDNTKFPAIANKDTYILPDSIRESGIYFVRVNGKQYVPRTFEQAFHGYWQVSDGVIQLSPAPRENGDIEIQHIYHAGPIKTTAELIGVRDIGPQVIILGALSKMATAVSDVVLSNNLKNEYNMLLQQSKLDKEHKFSKYVTPRRVISYWKPRRRRR